MRGIGELCKGAPVARCGVLDPKMLADCRYSTEALLNVSLPWRRSLKYRNAVLIVFATIALLVALMLFLPIFRMPRVYTEIISSDAMAPLLLPTDTVLVNKSAYAASGPARGDIVLFVAPFGGTSDLPVGRVIATPGDKLSVDGPRKMSVHDYGIYVERAGRWKQIDATLANMPPRGDWIAQDRLPTNCYIVLGDNRKTVADSRFWGCIERGDFIGRVVRITAPSDRARTLASDDLSWHLRLPP